MPSDTESPNISPMGATKLVRESEFSYGKEPTPINPYEDYDDVSSEHSRTMKVQQWKPPSVSTYETLMLIRS